jgi:hypothetical protein
MRVGAEAVLPVRVEEAWRALLDWERQSAWMVDAAEVPVLGRRGEGIGTRVAVRTRVLGIPAFTELLEVTRWEPPARLEMAHRGAVRGTGRWWLEPEGERTRFVWVEELTLRPAWIGDALLWIYRPIIGRLMRRSLTRLQALLSADLDPGRARRSLPAPRSSP